MIGKVIFIHYIYQDVPIANTGYWSSQIHSISMAVL